MDCSICCEKINASNHKRVICPFCDLNSCRLCVQTYLLSTTIDPHCMGCKNLWSREVIDGACTKIFRDTKLKNHRGTILFEREKCLMPETQDAVSRIIQSRKIDRSIIEAQLKVDAMRRHINTLHHTRVAILNGTDGAVVEKKVFVRKCPVSECRGFLSSRWKCQICENNICPDCNEIKQDNEHVCDQNNVDTVTLLKKDTKPCPHCGTMIFKISGCSQMWCPDCHTAFDWNTMKIETGRIHNPHYYDFQRTGGNAPREHGDIPCGGVPTLDELLRALHVPKSLSRPGHRNTVIPKTNNPVTDEIFQVHRLVLHIQHWVLGNQGAEIAENNQPLRVAYLLNDMSETTMKIILQKNEKSREKLRDRNNLLRMFCDVVGDLLRQMVVKQITDIEFLESAVRLREYIRSSFTTIHKRYTCSTDWINDTWEFTKNLYPSQKQKKNVAE